MGFNPDGTFSRVHNWQQDRDNGIRILADRHDEEDDNFATGFGLTFLRNGTVPMTGDLNMNGNGIKTIKAGTAAAPSLTWELDPSTGFYQPAPKQLALSIFGTNKLTWTEASTTISGKTVINGSGELLTLTTTTARGGGQDFIRFQDPTGSKGTLGYVSNNDVFTIANNMNTAVTINANGAERFRVAETGHVGIGESNPGGALLQIASTTEIPGILLNNKATGIGDITGRLDFHAASYTSNYRCGIFGRVPAGAASVDINELVFYTRNTERMKVDASGHLIPSGSLANDIGSTAFQFRVVYSQTINTQVSNTFGYSTLNSGSSAKSGLIAFFTPNQTRAGYIGNSDNSGPINYVSDVGGGGHVFSGGPIKFAGILTTASAANAFLDNTASNNLLRSTSSLRYKQDVQDIDSNAADNVLNLRPITYRSKAINDNQDKRWYGLIAEEVAEIEPMLVQWGYQDDQFDDEGNIKEGEELRPDGVQYERLCVLLLNVVKRMDERIKVLEGLVGV